MYATRHTVPTLLGQYNQLARQLGESPYLQPDTTLNNKYNVYPSTMPVNVNEPVLLQYFGIGIRGSASQMIDFGGEIPVMTPYMPEETNMDLYHPIPVRLIKEGDVIPAEELAKYRMKQRVQLDGIWFDAYWLKLLELNTEEPIKFETVDHSTESRTAYTPVIPALLQPAIPDATSGISPNIVVTCVLDCIMAGWELDNVITHMLGGNRELACISEYGLYTGYDFVVAAEGSNSAYNETLGAQLAMHRCIRGHDISSPNQQVTETFVLEQGNSMIARAFD